MSIRLWLMTADCFRCGTGIELTEAQQREAQRLLEARDEARRQETRRAAATVRPRAARPKTARPDASHTAVAPPHRTETRPHRAPPKRPDRIPAAVPSGQWLRFMPAWLVSLIFHMVAILLLGLWTLEGPQDSLRIHLSTSVGYRDVLGDAATNDPLEDAVEFDDAGSTQPVELPVELLAAGNDPFAREKLDADLPKPTGALPDWNSLEAAPVRSARMGRMFAGRDPALRAGRLSREGGTSFTEAAVTRGLIWIKRHQNRDGSWSLDNFSRAPGCRGRCSGHGTAQSDVAATALALLPMLGAGQTQHHGVHAKTVDAGLQWLIKQQRSDGDLRGSGHGRSMYGHGLASIVLCEAYGLTKDNSLRKPAQKALDFIVDAQHDRGGWRYRPRQAGDTSVVGWQLMALRSGQMAYLQVPLRTFSQAGRYLDDAQADSTGGRYSYMPRGRPTPTMTAEALLCRQYLGWPKDHSGLQEGIDYLMDHLPDRRRPNVYYWYYATQVLYHVGGRQWERWNARMRVVLTSSQEKKGHEAGSWTPHGGFANQGGRLYMTSLAVCTLEVYYRHLPLYRPAALEY